MIPVGVGQVRTLPVTLTFSRSLTALMIPSRQSGDLLAGMWQLIIGVGAVSGHWKPTALSGRAGRLPASWRMNFPQSL